VRRFVRFELGEGIEKEETDFAAEVAAQMGVSTPPDSKEAEPIEAIEVKNEPKADKKKDSKKGKK
jgi:elongation factor Ts